MKKFHDVLNKNKTIYGPASCGATTLLGTLFTDKELSWKGGENTSIVYSIDHRASMRMESKGFRPPIGKIAAQSAYEMFSWYKYLIVSLVFSHLGFWSGNLFLIAPFPDLCLLVPFSTDS